MYTPRERVISILTRILAQPYHFTQGRLADDYGKSKKVIREDLDAIRSAGITVEIESAPYYRIGIIPDRTFKELAQFQSLTDSERQQIILSIRNKYSSKHADAIERKLASLYDFQKLGLRALRRPMLDRIDQLEAAKRTQQQVLLVNYRSNTSPIRDRTVEPFHVDPELDTLQAFELESKSSKHFKLSRIERVVILDQGWTHQNRHILKPTDVFRIADPNQEWVHLKLNVRAYNLLIEAFPKALSEVSESAVPGYFEFESKVNHQFFGLLEFVLSNFQHLEILEPASLKVRVREQATIILENI